MPVVNFVIERKYMKGCQRGGYVGLLMKLKNLGFLLVHQQRNASLVTVCLPDDLTSRALVLDLLCKIGTGKTATLFQALVVCRTYKELMRFEVVRSPGDPFRYPNPNRANLSAYSIA